MTTAWTIRSLRQPRVNFRELIDEVNCAVERATEDVEILHRTFTIICFGARLGDPRRSAFGATRQKEL